MTSNEAYVNHSMLISDQTYFLRQFFLPRCCFISITNKSNHFQFEIIMQLLSTFFLNLIAIVCTAFKFSVAIRIFPDSFIYICLKGVGMKTREIALSLGVSKKNLLNSLTNCNAVNTLHLLSTTNELVV